METALTVQLESTVEEMGRAQEQVGGMADSPGIAERPPSSMRTFPFTSERSCFPHVREEQSDAFCDRGN